MMLTLLPKFVTSALIFAAGSGMAEISVAQDNRPYLYLEGEPRTYLWQTADGRTLNIGRSDKQGRVSISREPGNNIYILNLIWNKAVVTVPDACWEGEASAFNGCVSYGAWIEPEGAREFDAKLKREQEESDYARKASYEWVKKTLSDDQVMSQLKKTLDEHEQWMNTKQASLDVKSFSCKSLNVPAPTAAAFAAFEEGAQFRYGSNAYIEYATAAEQGYWRAAARLVDLMFEDEMWETTRPVIAWLLNQNIPSGYNKLADLVQVASRYGRQSNDEVMKVTTSLRWRAALDGDPVALRTMGDLFSERGDEIMAAALRECADQNRLNLTLQTYDEG